jgi:hypothetical protein
MITDGDDGDQGRVELRLVLEEMESAGWEVTVVTTQGRDASWLASVARLTPDVFSLGRFLPPREYPRFLWYLVQSRQIDVVVLAGDAREELVSRPRQRWPSLRMVNCLEPEFSAWRAGGFAWPVPIPVDTRPPPIEPLVTETPVAEEGERAARRATPLMRSFAKRLLARITKAVMQMFQQRRTPSDTGKQDFGSAP